MDRLVIESILADVSDVFYTDESTTENLSPTIVFGFKASQSEQIITAFQQLKTISDLHEVSLTICNTLVSGMYDIEIFTEALDEPIRICNKVIGKDFFAKVQECINNQRGLGLASNYSEKETWIKLSKVDLKDFNTELK
jgi:hypothetical protein